MGQGQRGFASRGGEGNSATRRWKTAEKKRPNEKRRRSELLKAGAASTIQGKRRQAQAHRGGARKLPTGITVHVTCGNHF